MGDKAHRLSFDLFSKVCSAIQDSDFIGNAEDYIQQYYHKPFNELTEQEAEYIVKYLKLGCLYKGDPKDLEPLPEEE